MIKSIDTFYNGNYFRSRLEARWAHFFDVAQIKYEYEPEGFTNGKERYLPDFYLPEVALRDDISTGVYIEIKPEIYNESEYTHGSWFEKNLCLFKGQPYQNIWGSDEDNGFQEYPSWDNCMKFWKCESCGNVKIEFHEGNYDYCPFCKERNGYRDCDFYGEVAGCKVNESIYGIDMKKYFEDIFDNYDVCTMRDEYGNIKFKVSMSLEDAKKFNMKQINVKSITTLSDAADCASKIRFEHNYKFKI